ncbi:pentapeptide repeat-containing protein [Nocardia sp. NPDC060256]|uniref:pentapeptide repeat-containing protein n=1 Tax=unclassified Nocardia TaxID=2637762 RepID=UPI00364C5B23
MAKVPIRTRCARCRDGAALRDANPTDTTLFKANLTGTNLAGADLIDTRLTNATL